MEYGIVCCLTLSVALSHFSWNFTLPQPSYNACLPLPVPFPRGQFLEATSELHTEPCAIEIPAALHSMPGQLPPKCGKYPKNKALVRQTVCIPGPELSCKRDGEAQPGWGDGAQHRTKKRWKQMGAETSGCFILSLVISVGHSLEHRMGAWQALRKSVISNPEHYQLSQCNLWLVCLPCEVVSARRGCEAR